MMLQQLCMEESWLHWYIRTPTLPAWNAMVAPCMQEKQRVGKRWDLSDVTYRSKRTQLRTHFPFYLVLQSELLTKSVRYLVTWASKRVSHYSMIFNLRYICTNTNRRWSLLFQGLLATPALSILRLQHHLLSHSQISKGSHFGNFVSNQDGCWTCMPAHT